jgi:hypothetical protein
LWWEPLSYPGVYPAGYAPQSLTTATPFPALLFTRPASGGMWPASQPIYLQYNVPITDWASASLFSVAPVVSNIPVTLSFQGARIVATPQQAMQPGTTYSFALTSDVSAEINDFIVQ